MAFTVVPLHNVSLPAGTRIPFGDDLVFQDTPQWVKEDKSFLNYLSHHDKQSVLNSKHAFVAEYEANAIGELDPEHIVKNDERQRTIQESKTRLAIRSTLTEGEDDYAKSQDLQPPYLTPLPPGEGVSFAKGNRVRRV